MPITAFKRYELKFALTKDQFEKIIPKINEYMNPDEYCQNGNQYSIYNIYYDTQDNNLIRTSLSKPYYKEKLRLRCYNYPLTLHDKVFMELKKKTGGIVHKRRAVMTLQEAYNFISSGKRPEINGYMNEQVANEIEYFLSRNEVSPAVYISYKRMAFFGKNDKDFRITFDSDILTRREDLFLEKGSFGENLLENGMYLMEVKISSSVPMWLAEIMAELEVYKTSFSKYGNEYQKYCLGNKSEEPSSNTSINADVVIFPFAVYHKTK